MTGEAAPTVWLAVILTMAAAVRLVLALKGGGLKGKMGKGGTQPYGRTRAQTGKSFCGSAKTTGSQVIQADCAQAVRTGAGIMAVIADGIGKENTGKVCAQIAADALLDRYEPYCVLNNPEYFFRTAFYEANLRIQKTIGERKGGACLAAVFLNGRAMHYALAGDARIALLRGGELIPISVGQTMDVLAAHAYEKGKLSKKEAVWSMEEKRAWNYLGLDGFHEIETAERPIRLKPGDQIFLASKGIWQELTWAEIEDVLISPMSLQEKAERLAAEADRKPGGSKENGSVFILEAEVGNETD